jgi:hypothetical protein
VQQNLLHLRRIRLDTRQRRIGMDLQMDRLPRQHPQHPLRALHAIVQMQQPRLPGMPSAERQQLPRDRRPPVARSLDLLEILPDRISGVQILQRHAAVAGDGRQQVVEIMRHSPCQPAHRRQPLRAQMRRLKGLP